MDSKPAATPNPVLKLLFPTFSEKVDEEGELPSPPPARKVEQSEAARINIRHADKLKFETGLILYKGKISTAEVFGRKETDLVPGKYEGGLKLWECSIDLIEIILREKEEGKLNFTGKNVLEVGCGHGLPGIVACLMGSARVHFQDFNEEVLINLTIPNLQLNMEERHNASVMTQVPEVEFFAGDWEEVTPLLSRVVSSFQLERNTDREMQEKKHLSGESGDEGYDIILMSETVYSIRSLPKLLNLIKNCLKRPHGVVYVAGKKHYFGVGGGTRQFCNMVEDDGLFNTHLLGEYVDGTSNVREVWKLSHKHSL